jgi:hypothetical protein
VKRAGNAPLRPIAPFFSDTAEAASHCFDRETGMPIGRELLKSYADALRTYHLSPESKFDNADYHDVGVTGRRHVQAVGIRYIGKESNNWEEKSVLGVDDELTVDYGLGPDAEAVFAELMAMAFGSDRKLAEDAGISRTTLRKLGKGQKVRSTILSKVATGIGKQRAEIAEVVKLRELASAEIAEIGLTEFARRLKCDPANLAKAISGKRKFGCKLISETMNYFSK